MGRFSIAFLLGIFLCLTQSFGWGQTAHAIINRSAVTHLPSSMQKFIDQQSYFELHASDADNRKGSDPTEAMKHFIDIDNYDNFRSMTHNYNSAIATYGIDVVEANGIVPWATIWTYDSLVAQLKRGNWTEAYKSAADLGHYVGDATMPLHNTKNYNGQLTENTGIHSRYETTMLQSYQQQIAVSTTSVGYIKNRIDTIFAADIFANTYVDTILAADKKAKTISGWNGSGTAPQTYYDALWNQTASSTKAHIQKASAMLARLWYSAWVDAGLLTTKVAYLSSSKEIAEFHIMSLADSHNSRLFALNGRMISGYFAQRQLGVGPGIWNGDRTIVEMRIKN